MNSSDILIHVSKEKFSICPKILYNNLPDRIAYENSAGPDQTAPEGASDEGLHYLPFHSGILLNNCIKEKLRQKSME